MVAITHPTKDRLNIMTYEQWLKDIYPTIPKEELEKWQKAFDEIFPKILQRYIDDGLISLKID